MRRAFMLTGLLLLLAASPAAARSTHRRQSRCTPGHAHLLASDAVAQVYEAGSHEDGFRPERIVGCIYGATHVYVVGFPSFGSGGGGGGSSVKQLAGTDVAVASSSSSMVYGTESASVLVRDLRTGRVIVDTPTGPPEPSPAELHSPGFGRIVGAGPVTSVVLKPDGALAWIASTPAYRVTLAGSYQVYAFDSSGKRTLAAGNDIDPFSLALAGSTVYWTQSGKPSSAALR
jgi:hypothetical protein